MAGRWRRRLAGAAAAGLALVALSCGEASRIDPDARVTVGGSVLDPAGSPVGGRPVKLGAGITESEAGFAVLTVGLSCTTGECRGAVRDATTDAAGRFSFGLEGHETQSSFGEAVSVLVSATGPVRERHVSGPLVSARFRVQSEVVELPPLRLVDPALALDGAADVVASWSTGAAAPYEVSFEVDAATPVWRAQTADSRMAVDPRLLEDTTGRVVVGGGYQEAIEGSDVEVRWRSPGIGYASNAGAPPSRGAACRYLDAAGRASPASPCELTDGDLVGPATAVPVCDAATGGGAGGNCAAATAIAIDLRSPVPAELVAVRGCATACALEVTSDGSTYRPATAASGDFAAVPLDGAPISGVRMALGDGSGLREVSVWGARPAPPGLRALDQDATDEVGRAFGGSGRGRDLPLVAVVGGIAALVAVLLGAAYAAGRRRAPGAGTRSARPASG